MQRKELEDLMSWLSIIKSHSDETVKIELPKGCLETIQKLLTSLDCAICDRVNGVVDE